MTPRASALGSGWTPSTREPTPVRAAPASFWLNPEVGSAPALFTAANNRACLNAAINRPGPVAGQWEIAQLVDHQHGQDLLGLLAAARGGLTVAGLAELIDQSAAQIRRRLRSVTSYLRHPQRALAP